MLDAETWKTYEDFLGMPPKNTMVYVSLSLSHSTFFGGPKN